MAITNKQKIRDQFILTDASDFVMVGAGEALFLTWQNELAFTNKTKITIS